MSPAPHHGPHPLLFFMVVLVSVNQCFFFHRDLIVCPALSEASGFIEFLQFCSLVIQAYMSVPAKIKSLQPTISVGEKKTSGFLHRGEHPFSLRLSAERVYTALIGLTTASPSFSLTVKHIKPETSLMI